MFGADGMRMDMAAITPVFGGAIAWQSVFVLVSVAFALAYGPLTIAATNGIAAHEQGLAGHSDADVLTHAVIDALLGAAGLGDIGQHFPDTDERWRDAPPARPSVSTATTST